VNCSKPIQDELLRTRCWAFIFHKNSKLLDQLDSYKTLREDLHCKLKCEYFIQGQSVLKRDERKEQKFQRNCIIHNFNYSKCACFKTETDRRLQ
jgi:hypothetical protein